jgi:hypothetical protein
MEDSGPVVSKVKYFIACYFVREVSSIGPIMTCLQDVINIFFPYTTLDDGIQSCVENTSFNPGIPATFLDDPLSFFW